MKANRFTVAAFLLAVLGALVAAFAPFGSTCEPALPGGTMRCRGTSAFSSDGSRILVVVTVPVLVALVPLLLRRRATRIVSAALLWTGCVVAILSVGIFFVPAATAMTIAATQHEESVLPP
jgi:hypothetical protein